MNIDSNFTDLLKDNNVRYILQKIHDELQTSKADKPHIITKVPSFAGKVELLNQDIPEENDSYFIRCLNDNDIIVNINFEARYPNKNKNDIDYLLLNSPEEFKTPYVAVSFDILDKQFLNNLYEKAIDILTVNSYPPETQKDIVYAAIFKIKAQTEKEEMIFSLRELDEEDRGRIEILKTLRSLEADKQIKILKFEGFLDKQINKNNIKFQADILYSPLTPFTGKDILMYKSFVLDPKSRKVSYPKLKNKSKITRFTTENSYYRVTKAFLDKKGRKILTYSELFQLIKPNQKIPKSFDRADKRKFEELINSLKQKFNNLMLFTYIDDSYELTP